MGFCYGPNGLCCDFCGVSGHGTRKISCPYGFCQAWACCPGCKAKKLHLRSSCGGTTHKDTCKKSMQEYQKKIDEKNRILDTGSYLRVAALSHGDRTKVIFRNKDMNEKAYWMKNSTYDLIALATNATIEDYAKLENIQEAKSIDIYDTEIEVDT